MNEKYLSRRSLAARLLCLLLVITMLSTMVACAPEAPVDNGGETTATPATTNDSGNSETVGGEQTEDESEAIVPVETEPAYETDSVQDYDIGKTITMLYWSDVEHPEFIAEEQSADLIVDSIYWRNEAVKNRLKVEFDYIPCAGNGSNVNTWVNYIGNLQKSGDDSVDIMAGYSQSVAASVMNGYCFNLLDESCDALTLDSNDSPWWPAALLEEAVINDKLFFCSGDISTNLIYMMYVCFVNNNMIAEYGITHPHDHVENNTWTYETFIRSCEGVYVDTDGDGQKSEGDTYGYMSADIHLDPWFYSTGVRIVDTSDKDNVKISDDFISGNKIIETAEMLNSLFWSSNYGLCTPNGRRIHTGVFNENRLLFCIDRCRTPIVVFDNADLSYAIAPQPKYSADMDYYATVNNPYTLYAIPNTCDNTDDVATVLEVMASESYRQVTPALFEITMKTKKVDDDTSAKMLDIVRSSVTFDIGRIFNATMDTQNHFRLQISSGQVAWASLMRSQKRVLTQKLEDVLAVYSD